MEIGDYLHASAALTTSKGPLLPVEQGAGCDLETDWAIELFFLPEIITTIR